MIQTSLSTMGPGIGVNWIMIELPYRANRNEEEVELDFHYFGPKPCWEIWDWLEHVCPDLHDEDNGPVSWWRTANVFQFFFRDRRTAALFHIRFGGILEINA